jgi:3-hydroxyisobutyrate dehydrogenase-like beta-hydroxyacid dehydrogenase
VPRAVTGELSVMAGGSPANVAAVQPVLRVLGDPARQFPTGALGTGHAMKAPETRRIHAWCRIYALVTWRISGGSGAG